MVMCAYKGQVISGEVEVTILKFSLRSGDDKMKGIMDLNVWKLIFSLPLVRLRRDKLKISKLYDYGDFGWYALVVSKGILQHDGRHFGGWRMYNTTCGINWKEQG